jgi:hypothetical protein
MFSHIIGVFGVGLECDFIRAPRTLDVKSELKNENSRCARELKYFETNDVPKYLDPKVMLTSSRFLSGVKFLPLVNKFCGTSELAFLGECIK